VATRGRATESPLARQIVRVKKCRVNLRGVLRARGRKDFRGAPAVAASHAKVTQADVRVAGPLTAKARGDPHPVISVTQNYSAVL
jgi:hypothetical protein